MAELENDSKIKANGIIPVIEYGKGRIAQTATKPVVNIDDIYNTSARYIENHYLLREENKVSREPEVLDPRVLAEIVKSGIENSYRSSAAIEPDKENRNRELDPELMRTRRLREGLNEDGLGVTITDESDIVTDNTKDDEER